MSQQGGEGDQQAGRGGDRRTFMMRAASVSMAGGLAASYGTFFFSAGQFLLTKEDNTAWLFVRDVGSIPPGESVAFRSPTGVGVSITRRAESDPSLPAQAEDFIALSSVCPHLGCRVHWEPQNNRYFCPCHNGAFDPAGQAIAGPPKAANQQLPRYGVKVENDLLYIEMPLNALGVDPDVFLSAMASATDPPAGPTSPPTKEA